MTKITTRLALLLAVAAIVPLLAFGVVSVVTLQQATRVTVVEGNTNVARRAAEHIELYLDSTVQILNALAAQLLQTDLQPWQQDRILKNFVLDFPEFDELTLFDDGGTAAVTSRIGPAKVSIPGGGSMTFKGAFMSPFSVDDDLLPTTILAVRLGGVGTSNGWLVGRVSLEELWRMVDRIRVGEGGVAAVVTAQGLLIAHGDPAEKLRVARRDSMISHPLIQTFVADPKKTVASAEYEGSRGELLGVAAKVPALGWSVIVEQPQAEAYAITTQLQTQLGYAIGGALLLMIGVGYNRGRSFIAPIFALMRGTTAVAEGHLDARVSIDTTDEFGQLGRAFNNMADKLVELTEDVRRQERHAVLGKMAAGLVHDLAHPIQNIGNSCTLMVQMFDDMEYRVTFKRTVEHQLGQVKRLLEDLRTLAQPKPLQKSPLDLNRLLPQIVESMQMTAQEAELTLKSELTPGSLFIEGDLYALNRVYGNLIVNAIQATPKGGAIVVRTQREQEKAIIEVADSGCGIAPEQIGKIFDEFHSTKKRGLGLGLAMSKKTIDQLGGNISVASVLNKGTTFTVRFPLMQARPDARGDAA